MIKSEQNVCYLCGVNNSKIIASGSDFQYETTQQDFNWNECTQCGHFFIDPLPTRESLDLIYPKSIGNYEQFEKSPGLAFKIKSFLDVFDMSAYISKKQNARFLDVGCASGKLLDQVKNKFPNFTVVHGLEISNVAAEVAKSKGHEVIISTIENTNLENNFYDTIVMQQVIEHVHDPKFVMEKLYNSMREGGTLIIETPCLHTWDHKFFYSGHWEGYHIPRHFNLWLEETMKKELISVGFNNVKVKYKLKPVHWTLSIQNYLRSKNKKNTFWEKRLNMNVMIPIEILLFTIIEIFQKIITKRTSNAQYIVKK